MTMKVATVEILIEKAHFEPRVAVAVAEAMDEAIDGKNREAQWVTVPILDSRMAVIDARFTSLEAKFDSKLTSLEARFDGKLTALEAKFDGKFAALETKLDARFRGFKGELKGELLTHLYGAILGQLAVLLGFMYFFASHVK